MKITTAALAASITLVASAGNDSVKPAETQAEGSQSAWSLTVGGFGRGGIRTSMDNGGADRETMWGSDMEIYYNAYENENFRLRLGMGGAFMPRQDAYSRKYGSQTTEHQVSDDGYVTYDYQSQETGKRSVELANGEFRLVAMPEWRVTESFFLGARMGVAFDWLQARCRNSSSWSWNSSFDTNIPGIFEETDLDSDSGSRANSSSKTEFAAYGILGLEATYMFSEHIGIYALCDWRIGDDAEFDCVGEKYKVDMSGWYAGAGVVVQF